jgi:hypothetical protein
VKVVRFVLRRLSLGRRALDHHLDRELGSLARIADGRDFSEGLESFFSKWPAAFEGG